MRQAILSAPKTLAWRDEPMPRPDAGEVVVRIRAALTCGTDLKTYRRGHPKLAFGPFGHEASGDVAATGTAVTKCKAGDPVMWVQTAPCGRCAQCSSGRENLCEHLTEGMALGTYADFIKLPRSVVERNLYQKPPELGYIEAAFLEPFSCIVHGWSVLRSVGVTKQVSEPIAIVGAGTIGLLHLAHARHAGFEAVVIARDPARRTLARELGASITYDSMAKELEEKFPVVIECGGTEESWRDALKLAQPGGTVMFFSGLPDGTQVPLDAGRVHYGELRCVSSFHFTPDDVRRARELLIEGVVPASKLISEVVALDTLNAAFQKLDRREAYKIALVPPPDKAAWI